MPKYKKEDREEQAKAINHFSKAWDSFMRKIIVALLKQYSVDSNTKTDLMKAHIKKVQNEMNAKFDWNGLDKSFKHVVVDKKNNEGHDLSKLHEYCQNKLEKFDKNIPGDSCEFLNENSKLYEILSSGLNDDE